MKQLKLLDKKVKAPGRITAAILGTGGALLLGAGISNIMILPYLFRPLPNN